MGNDNIMATGSGITHLSMHDIWLKRVQLARSHSAHVPASKFGLRRSEKTGQVRIRSFGLGDMQLKQGGVSNDREEM